ncbi:MAG: hypothetical protein Q8920_08485 [Bacillota bacterium]|nr:hypothetical protein [Bacillota bacterium]
MFIIVILIYSVVFLYDFLPLYKQKEWKEFIVNACLGLVSFTIALLLSFNLKIPSPEAPIREIITSIFGK